MLLMSGSENIAWLPAQHFFMQNLHNSECSKYLSWSYKITRIIYLHVDLFLALRGHSDKGFSPLNLKKMPIFEESE